MKLEKEMEFQLGSIRQQTEFTKAPAPEKIRLQHILTGRTREVFALLTVGDSSDNA